MSAQEEVEALSDDTGTEVVSRDDVDLRPQEYMRVFEEAVGREQLGEQAAG